MKIIIFKGGLGNQMFQYVLADYLAKEQNERVVGYYGRKEMSEHNGLELEKVFENISLPKRSFLGDNLVILYKVLNKLKRRVKKVKRDNFHIKNTVFDGYWQDAKFLTDTTKDLFIFRNSLDEENKEILKKIVNLNSVSVHIRRGDYLKSPDIYGSICDKDYYEKAISYFQGKFDKTQFIFFSDEMDYVMENFKIENAIYVTNNTGENSYLDLLLMSKCKHNIIANSTFSWWGAYLNKNKNKIVIMPERWSNTDDNSFKLFMTNWLKF